MAERWEIVVMKFEAADTGTDYINGELAKSPGWEPFATIQHRTGGWALLLKRKKA